MEKFVALEKFILRILFGKEAISGYYTPPKKKENKNYILDSVFPNAEMAKKINSDEFN